MNLIWFQTTKGHFGRQDLYLYTLKNLNSLINTNYFDKYISLKVFNEDDEYEILKNFPKFSKFVWQKQDPQITNESPWKDYSHYLIGNYLMDIVNVFSSPALLKHKYTYLIEDDSPEIVVKDTLGHFIDRAIEKMESDDSVFSINLRRFGRRDVPDYLKHDMTMDGFFSVEDHGYNFQNQVFRTLDMFYLVEFIKANFNTYKDKHPEGVFNHAFTKVFDKKRKITYNPEYAHSIHIGTEDSEVLIKEYNLCK